MKKLTCFFSVLILLSLNFKGIGQTFNVTKSVVSNALNNYLKQNKIINKELILGGSKILIGDINEDGKKDAIARYEIVPDMGNETIDQGIVFFINTGVSLKAVVDKKDIWSGNIHSIENGYIYIEELKYRDDDPMCCPSIKKIRTFKYQNNKVYEIK